MRRQAGSRRREWAALLSSWRTAPTWNCCNAGVSSAMAWSATGTFDREDTARVLICPSATRGSVQAAVLLSAAMMHRGGIAVQIGTRARLRCGWRWLLRRTRLHRRATAAVSGRGDSAERALGPPAAPSRTLRDRSRPAAFISVAPGGKHSYRRQLSSILRERRCDLSDRRTTGEAGDCAIWSTLGRRDRA